LVTAKKTAHQPSATRRRDCPASRIPCQSIHPSIHPPIQQSINPAIQQSSNPAIHQSINPSIHQSINPARFAAFPQKTITI
jgi:hypothetical protein